VNITGDMSNAVIFYSSQHGTEFNSSRGNLSLGVKVTSKFKITKEDMMSDFAEFAAWHAIMVRPHLNGFNGYDAVRYIFKDKVKAQDLTATSEKGDS